MAMKRKMLHLFVVYFLIMTFCQGSSVVDCEMLRVLVPLSEKEGRITSAASFIYGMYAKNPKSSDEMLNSDHLAVEFRFLTEEQKKEIPEYLVIKCFELLRAGDPNKVADLYQAEYQNNKRSELIRSDSKNQSLLQQFKQIVFLDKSFFGPYTRISFFLREYPLPSGNKKSKGIPGFMYFKRIKNQYMITEDISTDHLFDNVVSYYSRQRIINRKEFLLNCDTSSMKWVDFNVDSISSKVVMHNQDHPSLNQVLSGDNYLRIYLRCEPAIAQFLEKQKKEELLGVVQFFDLSVAIHKTGSESDILSIWSEKSRKSIADTIEDRKMTGDWPKMRHSPMGFKPKAVAILPTADAYILYYLDYYFKEEFHAKEIGILREDGAANKHLLEDVYYLSDDCKDIFRNPLFRKAVIESYSR